MILFLLKAEQFSLFDAPVIVKPHVRKDGTVVAPYASTRRKRLNPPPAAPKIRDLFEAAAREPKRVVVTRVKTKPAAEPAQKPAPAIAAEPAQPELVEHVTGRGRTLRGIVRRDLTHEQAKEIDPYTFRKDGGFFIREKHLAPATAEDSSAVAPSGAGEAPTITRKLERLRARRNGLPEPATVKESLTAAPAASPAADKPPVSPVAGIDYSAPFDSLPVPDWGVRAGTTKAQRRDINARVVKLLNGDRAEYNDADRELLRQYSGNGGCGDSLNEFYTDPRVAAGMWSTLHRLGLRGGAVLEPSCATGVFLATAPTGVKMTGVELDGVSAGAARALHGDRHEVVNASLEGFVNRDGDRQFDAVIGNVPFGLRGALIAEDKPDLTSAEAYFLDTALDKTRAGGLVALIVPTGVLDSRNNRAIRERLLRKGEFLGAQRMPNTAFEHSHTGVTTDVLYFRKRPDDVAGALGTVDQDTLRKLGVWDDEFLGGTYMIGRGAGNVLGRMEEGWRAKAGMGQDIIVVGSMAGVPEALAQFTPDEVERATPDVPAILEALGDDERAKQRAMGGAMRKPYGDAKIGDTKVVDGVTYVLQGNPLRWHRVDEVMQSDEIAEAIDIAADIEAAAQGDSREGLADRVRAWVDKYGIPARNKNLLIAADQDKRLHRLIGAVGKNGELSDLVAGRRRQQATGSVDSVAQALALQSEGRSFTAAELADRVGKPIDEVEDYLHASPGFAYVGDDLSTWSKSGAALWTTMDAYLSGELWPKLDAARAALDSTDLDPALRGKIETQAARLEETIAPKSLEDVDIQLNSGFIAPSMIAAFFNDKKSEMAAGGNTWAAGRPDMTVTFSGGLYLVNGGLGDAELLSKYLNRTGVKKDDKPKIDQWNADFKAWLCASRYRDQVEAEYNRKFRGFVPEAFSDAPIDVPGMNTDGLKTYQYGGLRWALAAGKGIIAADVGLGKAQPLDAKILTPTGWKRMGDIQVGDEVIAGDGSVTRVNGVFPQGEKEIFRVRFHDGAETECCDEHLWLTQTTCDRNNARRGCGGGGAPKVRPLSEIRETLSYLGREKNHTIPMVGVVQFSARRIPVEPYLLGVLIGDGGLSNKTTHLTNVDDSVVYACAKLVPPGNFMKQAGPRNGAPSITYNIGRSSLSLPFNELGARIADLGLNCLSYDKFVPDCYKFNTAEVRLQMLQGLMDADGYVDKHGVTVQYTSVSRRLAEDVQFLVHSLGGNATIKSRITSYTHKGEKRDGARSYTVHMRLPPSVEPFLHNASRRLRVRPKSKYLPTRYITAVEPVGRKLAQCISVEHPSHLYVTDDFVVTHNTVRALMLAREAKITGRAQKPMIVVPKSVLANWSAEVEKWFPGSMRVLVIGETYSRDKDGRLIGKPDSPAERNRKFHDAAQNDYDLILISQPAFNDLDLNPSKKGDYVEDDFWVQRGNALGNEGDARLKKIRKAKESYEQQTAQRDFQKRTDAIYFDDIGVDMLIADEGHCFPAGTLIDGKPIETYSEGDLVRAFDHSSGRAVIGRVANLQVRTPSSLYKVKIADGTEILCTGKHPFFTERGYVFAEDLARGDIVYKNLYNPPQNEKEGFFVAQGGSAARNGGMDLRALRGFDQADQGAGLAPPGAREDSLLLQQVLRDGLEASAAAREGGDRGVAGVPSVSPDDQRADAGPKPDGLCGDPREGFGDLAPPQAQPVLEGREWPRPNGSAEDARGCLGVANGVPHPRPVANERAELHVLRGHRQPGTDGSSGSGWEQPRHEETTGNRPPQGEGFVELRVDRVEIQERTSDGTFGGLCPGGVVYNIEVERYHNYFAADILVHNSYKNLYAARTRWGETPKFLGGQGLSNRALDTNLKARWIREQNGGNNVYLLTATPTKNSPLEVYSMLAHVAPEAFERIGVRNSEEFLDRYCEFAEDFYPDTTTGEITKGLVTVGFKNLDELREIMKRYIDRKTAADVGLKLPQRDDRLHAVDMTAAQKTAYEELREAAEKAASSGDSTGDSHIFSIMDKMHKAALDLELLDGKHAGAESPKFTAAAAEIARGAKDGGQVVFCDSIQSHEKLARLLAEAGIPRGQIAIINAQESPESAKRQNIADDFNAGKLKVVIGNTATMGEGINLQRGTTDIHHLDLPWEPASMQQRNGRGLRQGNINEAVRIHTYIAKGSFDAYRHRALSAKKDWQDLLWNGGDRVDNIAREFNMSRDDMMIMLSPDPEAARAKFEEDKAAATARFEAGERTKAAGQFVKFREMSRSYAGLKDKGSAAANRLRAKIEDLRTGLFANPHFKAKDALDSKTDVIVHPGSGIALRAGVGIELPPTGDETDPQRVVVSGVNERDGTVTVRPWGDTAGRKATLKLADVKHPKAYDYSEAAESAAIAKKLEEAATSAAGALKKYDDLKTLPEGVIRSNYDAIQRQLKEGAKSYKVSFPYGDVGMIARDGGELAAAESYEHGKKHDTHDYLLPIPEHREKALQAWAADQRAKTFAHDYSSSGRRTKTRYLSNDRRFVQRFPGKYDQSTNRWTYIGRSVFGDDFEKDARERFETEQSERIRGAKDFNEALHEAKPMAEVGYSGIASWPKKPVATLYARAKAEGILDRSLEEFKPSNMPADLFPKPPFNRKQTVRDALAGMASVGGHKDLASAIVVDDPSLDPKDKLRALVLMANTSGGGHVFGGTNYGPMSVTHDPIVVDAMRHLAERHPELGDAPVASLSAQHYDPIFGARNRDATVRQALESHRQQASA